MNTTFTDTELSIALKNYYDLVLESIPDNSELHYDYSERHLNKMYALLRQYEKKTYLYRTLKNVAVFIIAIVLFFGTWFAVDVNARDSFIKWVQSLYDNIIEYRFENAPSSETELVEYVINWVPDGYNVSEEYKDDYSFSTLYENKDQTRGFFIEYEIINENDQIFYSGEDISYETIDINGAEAHLLLAKNENDSNVIMWIDEMSGVYLHIDGNIGVEDLIKIAKNIKKQ